MKHISLNITLDYKRRVMYAKKHHITVIKLYIKLGSKSSPVIHKLVYPSVVV